MTDLQRNGALAFIPPRYGAEVVGGAEAVMAETAWGLAARGWDVDVLTTCAADHFTWANHYPAGSSEDRGITVHRFPTVTQRRTPDRDAIGTKILLGEAIPIQEQQRWMNDGLRVPELWHHLLDNAHRYRAIVVAPYMFWTTFCCGQVAPDRTIVMPCLHDEPPARLDLFQPLVNGARGVWFLSEPERDLADQIFRLPMNNEVVGSGVTPPTSYDPSSFVSERGLERPFVFYAGRREWGKGWSDLLDAFEEVVARGVHLDLVTAGVGQPDIPAGLAGRVHDVGFLTEQERNDAMAAAVAYVQPSAMESFSRTVLEAWLAGTFVIANARSEVVSWHVERSGAGVTYRNDAELVEALGFVAARPSVAERLAASGADYVRTSYDPEVVLDRLERTIADWTPAPSSPPSAAPTLPAEPASNEAASRTLMVGPYAPYRDGIATYAVQEVRSRRAAGEDVEVASPMPSAAHLTIPLGNATAFGKLARAARGHDKVIIQFYPELAFGRIRHKAERLAVWAALAALAKRVPTELRIHEIQWEILEHYRSERRAAATALNAMAEITVHTETERRRLAELVGLTSDRIDVVDHGRFFAANTELSSSEARAALRLPDDQRIAVSIGFLQRHKGFDRAITAFGQLSAPEAALYVVGDVRIDLPELEAYAEHLRSLAEATPAVELRRGFVGDAEFDQWIVAADVVVLPYREIWTSGVLERARVFGTPVIASRVGALGDQQHDGLVLVGDDTELRAALADALGVADPGGEVWEADDETAEHMTRGDVQARIARAAVEIEGAPAAGAADPIRALGRLGKARPLGQQPGVAKAKAMVDKAINFQITPIIEHVNRLGGATERSIGSLEQRIEELERKLDP